MWIKYYVCKHTVYVSPKYVTTYLCVKHKIQWITYENVDSWWRNRCVVTQSRDSRHFFYNTSLKLLYFLEQNVRIKCISKAVENHVHEEDNVLFKMNIFSQLYSNNTWYEVLLRIVQCRVGMLCPIFLSQISFSRLAKKILVNILDDRKKICVQFNVKPKRRLYRYCTRF